MRELTRFFYFDTLVKIVFKLITFIRFKFLGRAEYRPKRISGKTTVQIAFENLCLQPFSSENEEKFDEQLHGDYY